MARDRTVASLASPAGNGAVGADPGAASPRRRSRGRKTFVVAIALTILAVAAWALLGSSLLVVRHVRVIGEIPKLPNLHRTALMQVFMNHFDRAAFAQ